MGAAKPVVDRATGRTEAEALANAGAERYREERNEARAERDALAQAMHDAEVILGFDVDGNPTPASAIAGAGTYERYAEWHLDRMREARRDYDDALDEVP